MVSVLIIPRATNNHRANKLIPQYEFIEAVMDNRGGSYRILKTKKWVEQGIGSSKDCAYFVSRTYRVDWPQEEDSIVLEQIEKLSFAPYKSRADGQSNLVSFERTEDAVTFIIIDGPWDTAWTNLDVRCW